MAYKFVKYASGGSSSGGDCSGKHIIEVDELPEVGVEGAIYGVPTFSGAYAKMGDNAMLFSAEAKVKCITTNSETLAAMSQTMETIDGNRYCDYGLFYITDIPDVYIAEKGFWFGALSFGAMFGGLPFKGEITDVANATEDGYYAYIGKLTLYQYRDGAYVRMNEQGKLLFLSNGDGTCSLCWVTEYPNTNTIIPRTSPLGDTVTEIGSSAFRCALIEKVTIPDTITNIGDCAFGFCPVLKTINFDGTVAQWNAITKVSGWNVDTPATNVTCTDGTVTL